MATSRKAAAVGSLGSLLRKHPGQKLGPTVLLNLSLGLVGAYERSTAGPGGGALPDARPPRASTDRKEDYLQGPPSSSQSRLKRWFYCQKAVTHRDSGAQWGTHTAESSRLRVEGAGCLYTNSRQSLGEGFQHQLSSASDLLCTQAKWDRSQGSWLPGP